MSRQDTPSLPAPGAPAPAPELPGIALGERIGSGSVGVVHRGRDLRTGEAIAIKLLARPSPAALAELKREFRTARGIHHPNLVRLDTLETAGAHAALTMELVEGARTIVESVRDAPDPVARARDAFRSLAGAIQALHAHGSLHLDLKPSNVLCAADGRVVVLDFGLSLAIERASGTRSGTLAYMPPERALRGESSAATDWWAFGVLLHEALHGEPPFTGSFAERLLQQQRGAPEPRADLPGDLRALCRGLLDPSPASRWGHGEVLETLGAGEQPPELGAWVGRDAERGALERCASGVAHVRGPAGIGKTRLAQVHLASRGGLVLAGRCHPDERVPFNALDGVVDELALELPRRMPERRVSRALATAFPALAPLTDEGSSSPADPIEARRAAVRDLAELLHELARLAPLALWVDDLQWADADGAAVLRELVQRGLPDVALVLLTYRPAASERVAEIRGLRADLEVDLEPLPAEDVRRLYRALSGHDADVDTLRVSGGWPYQITRLARFGSTTSAERAREAGRHAGAALELVAIGGGLQREVLEAALGAPLARATLRQLEAECLVTWGERDRLELWHDRLREEIAGTLAEASLERLHARLSEAWMAQDEPEPRAVARHLRGAKRAGEARPWLERAARRAEAQLAFDRAARDYEELLELEGPSAELLARLGWALDNAGRAARAAEAWARAAEATSEAARGRELRLLAGTRFLYAGRLAEGRAALAGVLAEHGISEPRFPTLTAIARRLSMAARGFAAGRGPRSSPERVDALLGATRGLVMVEPVLADAFAVQALAESLGLADDARQMQTMGLEAVSEANVGGAMLRRSARRLLERVRATAERVDTPFARAWALLCEGCTAFFETRFPDAARDTGAALEAFKSSCVGAWHETNVATAFHIAALACAGEHERLARILPELRGDAAARGDGYSWVALHTAETYYAAIHEQSVERYLAEADAALAAWPSERFTSPHYQHAFATVSCLLYLGRAEEAWARLEAAWPSLERAGFLTLEWLGGQLRDLRARAALRRSESRPELAGWAARLVAGEAARIGRSELPALRGLAALLRASLAARAGRDAEREAQLLRASESLRRSGMSAHLRAIGAGEAPIADARLRALLTPA